MSSSDTQSTYSFTSFTDYSDNRSPQTQHHQQQQPHSTNHRYQKKRDASHIPLKQPSKRRKLNRTFDQYDIKDYDNYLNCLLTIIRMTKSNHKSIQQKYKQHLISDMFLNIEKLQKYEKIIITALNGSPSLPYNILFDTIKKCLQHIPIKYQEKVAIGSNYKIIFDTYLSKKHTQMPYVLSIEAVYYKYLCNHNRQREKKRMKKAQKQKKLLQLELKHMKQKYNELLSKLSVQNKRMEQMKTHKLPECIVIDGENSINEGNKDAYVTIATLKNVLKQLNEKNAILIEENRTLEDEGIALSKENFTLKERVMDLENQRTISHEMMHMGNINVIKREQSMESNEREGNEMNDHIQNIGVKEENDIEIEGNDNDFLMTDNDEYSNYSEDNDIILTNDNINDGIVRILEDNININWCPKCGIKVARTDEDIENKCSVMTCREKGCGDGSNYTYWCWDCRNIIDMKKLSFDPYTNEPAGACKNCREKSRIRRNKCKTINYAESVL